MTDTSIKLEFENIKGTQKKYYVQLNIFKA